MFGPPKVPITLEKVMMTPDRMAGRTSGMVILRQYPTQGQEVTMTEGVWKDAKATGKMQGNKLVVETTQGNGTQWHDEWTLAEDGTNEFVDVQAQTLCEASEQALRAQQQYQHQRSQTENWRGIRQCHP